MHRLDQQFLARLVMIFLLILAVVGLSAVLSQAARLTDDILEHGLNLRGFGLMLLALTPKMMEMVTPLSFGVAVVLVCVYRNENGTTLLLRTAGRSPLGDGAVLTMFSCVIAAGLLVVSGTLIPNSQKTYRALYAQLQQTGLEDQSLPVGEPFNAGSGVTLTIGAHEDDGLYRQVRVVDHSSAKETLILSAAQATLSPATDGGAVLELIEGQMQRISPDGRQTLLSFARTSLALDRPTPPQARAALDRPDTRSSLDLLSNIGDAAAAEELTRRLAAALSLISFSALAAGVLFDRRPQAAGQAVPALGLMGLLIAFLLLQSALISASGFSRETAWLVLGISAAPLFILPFISLGRRLVR